MLFLFSLSFVSEVGMNIRMWLILLVSKRLICFDLFFFKSRLETYDLGINELLLALNWPMIFFLNRILIESSNY